MDINFGLCVSECVYVCVDVCLSTTRMLLFCASFLLLVYLLSSSRRLMAVQLYTTIVR